MFITIDKKSNRNKSAAGPYGKYRNWVTRLHPVPLGRLGAPAQARPTITLAFDSFYLFPAQLHVFCYRRYRSFVWTTLLLETFLGEH